MRKILLETLFSFSESLDMDVYVKVEEEVNEQTESNEK